MLALIATPEGFFLSSLTSVELAPCCSRQWTTSCRKRKSRFVFNKSKRI